MADSHIPNHGTAGPSTRLGHQGHEGEADYGHEMSRDDIPPSSPGLSSAYHRHAPGHTDDSPSSIPTLQRRHTPGTSETLRIAIATPFSDQGRRKERQVSSTTTVSVLKDMVAQDEGETWERSGMRLVWQGRIVRDQELLGEIVGKRDSNQVHTFHLVARRLGGAQPVIPTPTIAVAQQPAAQPQPTSSSRPDSRNARALADSVHFVLFLVRHYLCCLLETQPLGWYETIPPPTVDQATAKEAVMSVIAAFAAIHQDREEGWENWQAAFQDASEVQWEEKTRENFESEIKSLWSARVGRHWNETDAGEQVSVDLDNIPYQLNLPPLRLMTPSQLVHLTLYLRLTSLLPLLNDILPSLSTPAPSPIQAPPLPTPTMRSYGLRVRISRATVSHLFFSAVKVAVMAWMLTKGLKWDDVKLWIIGCGLLGWYIADAISVLRPGIIWNRPRAQNGQVGQNGLNGQNGHQGGGAIPNQPVTDAPVHGTQAAGPMPTATARFTLETGNIARRIPLLHLNTDSEQLLLSSPRPRRPAFRIVTQLLLPIALWFITLIPEWETLRARTIRRRERAMRVWVGELTAAQNEAQEPSTEVPEGADGAAAPVAENADQASTEARPPVFPQGLSVQAKRYYERVLARSEGIDWEEEREAQRALGVGEEDPQEGFFRL